jgi:hypothetical protein
MEQTFDPEENSNIQPKKMKYRMPTVKMEGPALFKGTEQATHGLIHEGDYDDDTLLI